MATAIAGTILPLSTLLERATAAPWNYYLYVEDKKNLTAQTKSAVLDPADAEGDDPDADPAFAKQHSLEYLLAMADVRTVLENAQLQLKRDPSPTEALEALRFYVSHDAYVIF